MALPSSGQLDMATIRNYYNSYGYAGGSYSLSAYRGLPKTMGWSCNFSGEGGSWVCEQVVTSYLPSSPSQIGFSDFYGANLDPGTQPPPPGGGGGP